jgi:DNA-binding transcriptional ArsR family regulator
MSTHATVGGSSNATRANPTDLSTDELLDLFGDEYTRRTFKAISDQPRCGRSIAEELDVSRATVYRRLNALVDAELVSAETALAEDGNHRNRYEAVVDGLSIALTDGELRATVDE